MTWRRSRELIDDTDGNEDWHLFRVDLDAPDEPAVDLTPLSPGSCVFAVGRIESTRRGTRESWMTLASRSSEAAGRRHLATSCREPEGFQK